MTQFSKRWIVVKCIQEGEAKANGAGGDVRGGSLWYG